MHQLVFLSVITFHALVISGFGTLTGSSHLVREQMEPSKWDPLLQFRIILAIHTPIFF